MSPADARSNDLRGDGRATVTGPVGDQGELRRYYRERARHYDRVYAKPERRADLATLTGRLVRELTGRRVLELAAGTGYWTERYGPSARSVVATDVNDETLAVARARCAWPATVTFRIADAYAIGGTTGTTGPEGARFDAVFAGFFWSHVLSADLTGFLAGIAAAAPGARLVVVDNRYVEGSNHPITRRDADGNTYQRRRLDDGTEWEVLKNFPGPAEVRAALSAVCSAVVVSELRHYWMATGRLAPGEP